ncbi:putative permease YjgP/YjgQ family protein [Kordia sp. SMS9]|uniref:LptF/LptG family permease n=1 Tax=Kordia sp. SMS9 TaxID=2282170 RepID=UPI000E0DE9D9|nr:LptF/LptG family permease [Kordia sp. SMS9]AXG70825.1 putative permease YjgP/YjgQ family protein [Kordia sp. SMS9]
MKILDRYILKSYLLTFLTVFVIFMFIFILQTVWLFIGELAGKGLDVEIIFKFLLYTAPKLIPLVLPLSILVSSIMTFGRFAESYEFAAMKSTGISLQRAMRSLTIFIVLLGIGTFFFSNNVIPWSEFKQYNLRKNLAKKKPALAIGEGVFNDIGNINIKVDKKYGDNDQLLDKVIIHQKSNDKKNRIVIKSKNGELKSSPDSDILQMVLFDGNRYEDVKSTDPKAIMRQQHAKVSFEKYIMNVDLRDINKVDLEDESYSTYKMFKVQQLNDTIASFERKYDQEKVGFGNNMYKRTGIVIIEKDTTNRVPLDSIKATDNLLDVLTLKNKKRALDISITNIKGRRTTLDNTQNRFKRMEKKINHQKIYLHDKFAVAIACIILFFVGAPLGAIIRKGGIGLPMVIAICLFLAYHFIGIFGKNSAEDGSIPPWLGTWLSTLIMLPLSIYFTRRATSDQGLFSFSLKGFFVKLTEEEDEETDVLPELAEITETDRESTEKFKALSNTRLMNVVKRYRQFNYTEGERSLAIGILEERGISQRRLKVLGFFENVQYDKADSSHKKFFNTSKLTFLYYIISSIFGGAIPILLNNVKMDDWLIAILFAVWIISLLFYLYNFIKSFFHLHDLSKALGDEGGINNTVQIIYFIGIPIYFIMYFFIKNRIKQALDSIE